MNRITKISLASLIALAASACGGTKGEVVRPDANGFLPTGSRGQAEQATTVTAAKVDMTDFRTLALVSASDPVIKQITNIGYFNEVINIVELQKRIVQNNVQDKVPSISDRIGISNASKHFRKFLWIHFETETKNKKNYVKLVGTDPTTLTDVFVAERELVNPIRTWDGYTDQNTWYPLYNSLIAWLKSSGI